MRPPHRAAAGRRADGPTGRPVRNRLNTASAASQFFAASNLSSFVGSCSSSSPLDIGIAHATKPKNGRATCRGTLS